MTYSLTGYLQREIRQTLGWPVRLRLILGAVVSYALFSLATSWAGIFPMRGLAGSLLLAAPGAMGLTTAIAALVVSVLLGRIIVGKLVIGSDLQSEGGLVAAMLGMVALAVRVGPVHYAYFNRPEPKVFVVLAAELMLLYIAVIACWLALQWTSPASEHAPEPIGVKLGAAAAHAVVMSGCMVFMAQSTATDQGLAAVGISSMLAAMAAHTAFPVRSSFWYWIGALLVGVAGYGMGYFNPTGLATGYPDGMLGALARATPVAYACAGPGGAIMGFWIAYRWNTEPGEERGEGVTR
jgi:hypothetical protein